MANIGAYLSPPTTERNYSSPSTDLIGANEIRNSVWLGFVAGGV